MGRMVIRIDAATNKACAKVAKEKEITPGEACDLLVATAVKRRAAVSKYTTKPAKKAKPARKPAPKPKAAKKRVRKPKAAPNEMAEQAASSCIEDIEERQAEADYE